MPQEINELIAGFHRFRDEHYEGKKRLFQKLAQEGQRPKYLVIACADARVDPSVVCDTSPGEMFVVRNVANLVPPYQMDSGYHGVSAAIEFGIQELGIRHLIIFGHSQCGGIRALIQGHAKGQHSFVANWMRIAESAKKEVPKDLPLDEQMILCEQKSIEGSLRNLLTFPFIKERVEKGQLFLHGWYFTLEDGMIWRKENSTWTKF